MFRQWQIVCCQPFDITPQVKMTDTAKSVEVLGYNFTPYSMEEEWNDVGGVYMFAKQNSEGDWEIAYVGKTKSFKDRMSDHEEWQDAVSLYSASAVLVTVESVETKRASLEKKLIEAYSPPLNDHYT